MITNNTKCLYKYNSVLLVLLRRLMIYVGLTLENDRQEEFQSKGIVVQASSGMSVKNDAGVEECRSREILPIQSKSRQMVVYCAAGILVQNNVSVEKIRSEKQSKEDCQSRGIAVLSCIGIPIIQKDIVLRKCRSTEIMEENFLSRGTLAQ